MPESSPALPQVRQQAQALVASGDEGGARALLERAVEAGRAGLAEGEPELLATMRQLAGLHRQAGDPASARRLLEQAVAARQRFGDDDAVGVMLSYDLAVVADELGNRHVARSGFARVAQYGPSVLGEGNATVEHARNYMAQCTPLPEVPSADREPPSAAELFAEPLFPPPPSIGTPGGPQSAAESPASGTPGPDAGSSGSAAPGPDAGSSGAADASSRSGGSDLPAAAADSSSADSSSAGRPGSEDPASGSSRPRPSGSGIDLGFPALQGFSSLDSGSEVPIFSAPVSGGPVSGGPVSGIPGTAVNPGHGPMTPAEVLSDPVPVLSPAVPVSAGGPRSRGVPWIPVTIGAAVVVTALAVSGIVILSGGGDSGTAGAQGGATTQVRLTDDGLSVLGESPVPSIGVSSSASASPSATGSSATPKATSAPATAPATTKPAVSTRFASPAAGSSVPWPFDAKFSVSASDVAATKTVVTLSICVAGRCYLDGKLDIIDDGAAPYTVYLGSTKPEGTGQKWQLRLDRITTSTFDALVAERTSEQNDNTWGDKGSSMDKLNATPVATLTVTKAS